MASVVSQALPLELLGAGESGIILEIDGRRDFVVRLEEMGLHAGVRVCMVRPGSPCILEINDQRFSIRLDDFTKVLVDLSS